MAAAENHNGAIHCVGGFLWVASGVCACVCHAIARAELKNAPKNKKAPPKWGFRCCANLPCLSLSLTPLEALREYLLH